MFDAVLCTVVLTLRAEFSKLRTVAEAEEKPRLKSDVSARSLATTSVTTVTTYT
jgi:hypothetical protein